MALASPGAVELRTPRPPYQRCPSCTQTQQSTYYGHNGGTSSHKPSQRTRANNSKLIPSNTPLPTRPRGGKKGAEKNAHTKVSCKRQESVTRRTHTHTYTLIKCVTFVSLTAASSPPLPQPHQTHTQQMHTHTSPQ